MSRGDYPDHRQRFPRGDPIGPSSEEIRRRFLLQNKKGNYSKFEGPYGFKETKHKRNIIDRYPRTFTFGFAAICIGIFYSKLINDVFFRQPTEEEIFIDQLRIERMKRSGFWYGPWPWLTGNKKPSSQE